MNFYKISVSYYNKQNVYSTSLPNAYSTCLITYITQADSPDAALSKVWHHITQDPNQVVTSISATPLANTYFLQ